MTPYKKREIARLLNRSIKETEKAYESYRPYKATNDHNAAVLYLEFSISILQQAVKEIETNKS
jgi:hypothetical protein